MILNINTICWVGKCRVDDIIVLLTEPTSSKVLLLDQYNNHSPAPCTRSIVSFHWPLLLYITNHIHTALMYAVLFHIVSTLKLHQMQSGVQRLAQGHFACGLEEPGIKPPTRWLVADLLYFLSHSLPLSCKYSYDEYYIPGAAYIKLVCRHVWSAVSDGPEQTLILAWTRQRPKKGKSIQKQQCIATRWFTKCDIKYISCTNMTVFGTISRPTLEPSPRPSPPSGSILMRWWWAVTLKYNGLLLDPGFVEASRSVIFALCWQSTILQKSAGCGVSEVFGRVSAVWAAPQSDLIWSGCC